MITTCPKCGKAYDEQSREEADSPNRTCLDCFRAMLKADPLAPIKAEIELPEHARLRLQAKVRQVFGGGEPND